MKFNDYRCDDYGALYSLANEEIRPNSTNQKSNLGFEMLVNNFSAGFLAFGMMLVAFYSVGPVVANLTTLVGQGVDALVTVKLLPLANTHY